MGYSVGRFCGRVVAPVALSRGGRFGDLPAERGWEAIVLRGQLGERSGDVRTARRGDSLSQGYSDSELVRRTDWHEQRVDVNDTDRLGDISHGERRSSFSGDGPSGTHESFGGRYSRDLSGTW